MYSSVCFTVELLAIWWASDCSSTSEDRAKSCHNKRLTRQSSNHVYESKDVLCTERITHARYCIFQVLNTIQTIQNLVELLVVFGLTGKIGKRCINLKRQSFVKWASVRLQITLSPLKSTESQSEAFNLIMSHWYHLFTREPMGILLSLDIALRDKKGMHCNIAQIFFINTFWTFYI